VNRPPAVWDRSMRMCGDGYVGAFPLFIIEMRSRHCIVGGVDPADFVERITQQFCAGLERSMQLFIRLSRRPSIQGDEISCIRGHLK